MKTRQVVVGFQKPVDVKALIKLLESVYGKDSVVVGQGQAMNGIPSGWIVVQNDQ